MGKQVIPFTTEGEWLAVRVQDITSTECAVLFDASPYGTPFELFYAKRDRVIEQRAGNARMTWGRRLQDPIALGVAEDHGLEVRKKTEYIRDPDARVGASFDFQITAAHGPEFAEKLSLMGEGLMEVKTVDPSVFHEAWLFDEGEAIEAPPHIELQVQHQLLVSGLQWALIVALIGGNRVSVIERAYDPALGAAIVRKAAEFWTLVDQGTPPSPDYTRDAAILAKVYLNSIAGKTLDAREDEMLAAWASEYHSLGEHIREYAKDRDAMRARILERIGDHSRVLLPNGTLSAGTVREALVPQHLRAAYRNVRFNIPKARTA